MRTRATGSLDSFLRDLRDVGFSDSGQGSFDTQMCERRWWPAEAVHPLSQVNRNRRFWDGNAADLDALRRSPMVVEVSPRDLLWPYRQRR